MRDTTRQFIRHPTDIPLEFSVAGTVEKINIKDVGTGGLCFTSSHQVATGEQIHIIIPICKPEFDAQGIVRWCKPTGSTFLIGVAFQQKEVSFAVRMVEQICHIEDFRSQLNKQQGIDVSREQAAQQWIKQHGHTFPQI